jgi:hypothetical protein
VAEFRPGKTLELLYFVAAATCPTFQLFQLAAKVRFASWASKLLRGKFMGIGGRIGTRIRRVWADEGGFFLFEFFGGYTDWRTLSGLAFTLTGFYEVR